MAQFSDEWNQKRIDEILKGKYLPEKEKLIKDFAKYLKETSFTLESQKTKLKHLKEFFDKLGTKKVSTLTEEETKLYVDDSKFREMKISLKYFFDWYKNNPSTKSYAEIKKCNRTKLIGNILSFEGFNKRQKEIIHAYYKFLQRFNCQLESYRGYLQMCKLFLLDIKKDPLELTEDD